MPNSRIPILFVFLLESTMVGYAQDNMGGGTGISKGECERRTEQLIRTLKNWELQTGNDVVSDKDAFYDSQGNLTTFGGHKDVFDHLFYEEGVKEPMRSGHEVEMYNSIKEFMANRKQDEMLTHDKLMEMGLNSSVDRNGKANLQNALLTVHNVVRILARPDQWYNREDKPGEYGHPLSDPVYSIMQDIRGLHSTKSDKQTLPDMMDIQMRNNPDDRREVSGAWTLDALFNTTTGVFPVEQGVRIADGRELQTSWNGGSHYYYWIGAFASTTMGTASAHGGAWFEWGIKTLQELGGANEDLSGRGWVQTTYTTCGGGFGSAAAANGEHGGFLAGHRSTSTNYGPSGNITNNVVADIPEIKTPETPVYVDFTGYYQVELDDINEGGTTLYLDYLDYSVKIRLTQQGKSWYKSLEGELYPMPIHQYDASELSNAKHFTKFVIYEGTLNIVNEKDNQKRALGYKTKISLRKASKDIDDRPYLALRTETSSIYGLETTYWGGGVSMNLERVENPVQFVKETEIDWSMNKWKDIRETTIELKGNYSIFDVFMKDKGNSSMAFSSFYGKFTLESNFVQGQWIYKGQMSFSCDNNGYPADCLYDEKARAVLIKKDGNISLDIQSNAPYSKKYDGGYSTVYNTFSFDLMTD